MISTSPLSLADGSEFPQSNIDADLLSTGDE
jgi:hypothetical protein